MPAAIETRAKAEKAIVQGYRGAAIDDDPRHNRAMRLRSDRVGRLDAASKALRGAKKAATQADRDVEDQRKAIDVARAAAEKADRKALDIAEKAAIEALEAHDELEAAERAYAAARDMQMRRTADLAEAERAAEIEAAKAAHDDAEAEQQTTELAKLARDDNPRGEDRAREQGRSPRWRRLELLAVHHEAKALQAAGDTAGRLRRLFDIRRKAGDTA